jgi:hypothetical protein
MTFIGEYAFSNCSGFSSAITFPSRVSPGPNAFDSNQCNWMSCCNNCTLTAAEIAEMCLCDSSCEGVCSTTVFPTGQPTSFTEQPSGSPTYLTDHTFFRFGVEIGDIGILGSGKEILVDYVHDARRGD